MSDKVRARLNKLEAEFIGLKVKENENGRNTARYRITQEQHHEVILLRTTPNKRRFVETIKKYGGEIHLNSRVVGININNNLASEIIMKSDSTRSFKFDCLINTLPINEMVSIIKPKVPTEISILVVIILISQQIYLIR